MRVSRVSAYGTPRRGNGITEIVENSVRRALPRQRGHDINGVIPDLKSEIPPKETTDPESAAFMAVDLRKEPETILSSILPFSPWGGHGNDFHHISVTALPPLAYQWLPPMPPLPPCPHFIRMGGPGERRRQFSPLKQ
jgi:hypothetical protein